MVGARYHVSSRVNNREMLLDNEFAKRLFETVLYRAKKRYSFSIENFVVMENHVHMIIYPQENESLSKIMQWVLSVYAIIYNRKMGRTGHFWGERFFSRVINSLQQYLAVFEYINANPVKAGLVALPEQWRYSGAFHRAKAWHFLITYTYIDDCLEI